MSGGFLRSHKIDLAARKSWCESNDPHFAAKAADVVGLYVAPPEKAIVLCVDEKPSIQALERAQGYLKLPNGRALTGQSHDLYEGCGVNRFLRPCHKPPRQSARCNGFATFPRGASFYCWHEEPLAWPR